MFSFIKKKLKLSSPSKKFSKNNNDFFLQKIHNKIQKNQQENCIFFSLQLQNILFDNHTCFTLSHTFFFGFFLYKIKYKLNIINSLSKRLTKKKILFFLEFIHEYFFMKTLLFCEIFFKKYIIKKIYTLFFSSKMYEIHFYFLQFVFIFLLARSNDPLKQSKRCELNAYRDPTESTKYKTFSIWINIQKKKPNFLLSLLFFYYVFFDLILLFFILYFSFLIYFFFYYFSLESLSLSLSHCLFSHFEVLELHGQHVTWIDREKFV